MKGDLFVDLAASLERARFDYLLVEDTSMVEDAYGRSMETTLKYGLLAPEVRSRAAHPAADAAHEAHRHRRHAVDELLPPVHGGQDDDDPRSPDRRTGRAQRGHRELVARGAAVRLRRADAAQRALRDGQGVDGSRWTRCGTRGRRALSWSTRRLRATPITPRCTPSTSRASTSGPAGRSTPFPARNGARSSCRPAPRLPGATSPPSTRSRCSRTARASRA